jgi:hypothetical protein
LTLRLSPAQLDIVNHLKIPGNTPESYANMKDISEHTVWVQLSRLRAKDKEARVFHATYNGLMGGNPNLLQFLKVTEGLTSGEKMEVERRLQTPNGLRDSVEKRGQKGRRKGHDYRVRKPDKRRIRGTVK